MSHFHFCDVAGHFWQCDGEALRPDAGDTEPCVCMCADCEVPMVSGDHSGCCTELLACSEHLYAPRTPEVEASVAELLCVPADKERVKGAIEKLKQNKQLEAVCVWCSHGYSQYSPILVDEHFASDCPNAPQKLREPAGRRLVTRKENATKQ